MGGKRALNELVPSVKAQQLVVGEHVEGTCLNESEYGDG